MSNTFKISIIGLGLMGGSLAFALRGFRGGVICGFDENPRSLQSAKQKGAIDVAADSAAEAVLDADLTILCLPPMAVFDSLRDLMPHFKPGSAVIEICGVKTGITRYLAENARPDVVFAGLHPMAGKENGGFENADPAIFMGAGFIIVPVFTSDGIELLTELSRYIGAGRITVNNAETHDKIIAYSSDLMHAAAACLCYDYPGDFTQTHAAGAFRDCTRIASLDAKLWTELLLMNKEYTLSEMKKYVNSLAKMTGLLENGDKDGLTRFLERCSCNKKEMLEK